MKREEKNEKKEIKTIQKNFSYSNNYNVK